MKVVEDSVVQWVMPRPVSIFDCEICLARTTASPCRPRAVGCLWVQTGSEERPRHH